MKIIFIHGMNQQKYNAISLKQHWIDIFKQGLACSQFKLRIDDFQIEMAFYADLIQQLNLHNALNVNQLLAPQQIPLLPIFQHATAPDLSTRLSIYGQRIKDHLLRDVVAMMSHFPKLHAELIHEFLIETYLYLSNPEFMQQVHTRIQACFQAGQPHLIVAHSLGSVIAYNFLQQYPEYQVRGMLSLGSPLAFPVIHDRIVHPIRHPAGLQGPWYNFYSTEDFLTAYPLQKAPFDFQPAIINQVIETFEQSPHQITGYLQHPDVVKCIVQLHQSA